MLDWLCSAGDLRRARVDTAIIPLGSIEQHGEALPVGTDHIIACAIAQKVAQRINAYLLPGIPVGTCQEHTGGTGSVWISAQTYMHMLSDICFSLTHSGIRKIALILGHGGLWAVKPAVRQINLTHRQLSVLHVTPLDMFGSHLSRLIQSEQADDVHAGEQEASLCMHLVPDAVRLDRAEDSVPKTGREFLDYVPMLELCASGVWGFPTRASREKGEQIFNLVCELTQDYLLRTFSQVEQVKKRIGNS